MGSKFFVNNDKDSLYKNLEGISKAMRQNLHTFNAVCGYFRASGYFALQDCLKNAKKIQILVGIDSDTEYKIDDNENIILNKNIATNFYAKNIENDIKEADYKENIENGIKQFKEDIKNKRIEIKMYKDKNLHAKFYLFLPENFNEHSDGQVIMGSSNLTASGLGITEPKRYEMNVRLKDNDDIKFCKDEFEKLWAEAIEIEAKEIIKTITEKSPQIITPYEVYIKLLIEEYSDFIESNLEIEMPENFIRLEYQIDAVKQAYNMLTKYNGCILADVVGLGKTIIAMMIAKTFIKQNGEHTRVLVVAPPSLEYTWRDTAENFKIEKGNFNFISLAQLDKIEDPKFYDLIMVDEAHNFRNSNNDRYKKLSEICKSDRKIKGKVSGSKKVILLSATPLNNKPNDLKNQIYLFQDKKGNIRDIDDLNSQFDKWSKIFNDKNSKKEEKENVFKEMREKLLSQIAIRRTRKNLMNNKLYKEDLKKQKIEFPKVLPPEELKYSLENKYKILGLFNETLSYIMPETGENGLNYAFYNILTYQDKYTKEKGLANLSGFFKTLLLKRLESSFEAFKISLENFKNNTENMLEKYENEGIIEVKIRSYLDEENEADEMNEDRNDKSELKTLKKEDLNTEFENLLKKDLVILKDLCKRWQEVKQDPKLNLFLEKFDKFFDERNTNKKIVIFSESLKTAEYLEKQIKEKLKRNDILMICSKNRKENMQKIRENFDENYKEKKNEINILISTDTLSEGINLHRANIIINYDSPWNPTKLIQRIGRINRVGTKAKEIHNYVFQPSDTINKEIKLYETILNKLAAIHSTIGEDAQVFSAEEILREFELNSQEIDIQDEEDKLKNELKELYEKNRNEYNRIKNLPKKSRSFREFKPILKEHNKNIIKGSTFTMISNSNIRKYYLIDDQNNIIEFSDFVSVAKALKADKNEKNKTASKAEINSHFNQVKIAMDKFLNPEIKFATSSGDFSDVARKLKQNFSDIESKIIELEKAEKLGNQALNSELVKLANLAKKGDFGVKTKEKILELHKKYENNASKNNFENNTNNAQNDTKAEIIISETFI